MPSPEAYLLPADGPIPNHPTLPLLLNPGAFQEGVTAIEIQKRFEENGWKDCWVNGVFSYHHFHSTAHEVLGCFSGTALVQFGGETGPEIRISAGDAVIIPAGVGHKNLGASDDFGVVGAYPPGPSRDVCSGEEFPPEELKRRIAAVPLPPSDPVGGSSGHLFQFWK